MRNSGLISLLLTGAILFAIAIITTGCTVATFETALQKSKPFGLCVAPVVAAASCLYEAAKDVSSSTPALAPAVP
jgi:hypothetical protein